MNILCMSDTHNHLPDLDLENIDLILHAGDYTYHAKHDYLGQLKFFENQFCPWVRNILDQGVEFYFCSGNHETFSEVYNVHSDFNDITSRCCLDDSSVLLCNHELTIAGFPWTPRFGDWAYNADDTPDDMGHKAAMLPDRADIILSHGPVFGINDIVDQGVSYGKRGNPIPLGYIHCGSQELLKRVQQIQPRLFVSGHLHFNYNKIQKNGTTYVGCSLVDEQYNLCRQPVLVTI